MNQQHILKLKEHQNYCGRPFTRLDIQLLPLSGKYCAQFYGSDYMLMFSIYAGTYELLMSDISELINEVNQTK